MELGVPGFTGPRLEWLMSKSIRASVHSKFLTRNNSGATQNRPGNETHALHNSNNPLPVAAEITPSLINVNALTSELPSARVEERIQVLTAGAPLASSALPMLSRVQISLESGLILSE